MANVSHLVVILIQSSHRIPDLVNSLVQNISLFWFLELLTISKAGGINILESGVLLTVGRVSGDRTRDRKGEIIRAEIFSGPSMLSDLCIRITSFVCNHILFSHLVATMRGTGIGN
jgi:hypothetical protein